MLKIILMLTAALFCIRGASYGLYVLKQKNASGGIFMLALCVFALGLLAVTLYPGIIKA